MSLFKDCWKGNFTFEKGDALTTEELHEARRLITSMLNDGVSDLKVMNTLQERFPKLKEQYRVETLFFTESSRLRTKQIKRQSKREDITKFKIDPRGDTCKECLAFCRNGKRIFSKEDLTINGRSVPPLHPQCRCILIPIKKK